MTFPSENVVDLATLKDQIGKRRDSAESLHITQDMINAFADATRDYQFIHVDPQRARETPFGTTVAHGFLTLSLLPPLMEPILLAPENSVMQLNYGLNRVRFPQAVPVDSRIGVSTILRGVDFPSSHRILLTWGVEVRIEGVDKPAMIAELLLMWELDEPHQNEVVAL